MKNLFRKLALPLAITSILSMEPVESVAQERDTLSTSFINSYDTLKKDLIYRFEAYFKDAPSMKELAYDLDGDGKVDVKELFVLDEGTKYNKHPSMYSFDLNKDGNFSDYLDIFGDGLNGNEFYKIEDEERDLDFNSLLFNL